MAKLSLTQGNIDFIQANRLLMCGSDIAAAIGLNKSVVQRYMKENKLTAPRELFLKWRAEKLRGKSIVSEYADFFIFCCYLDIPVKAMATILNYGDGVIQRRVKQLGLVIPREIIEQRIADSRIQKGAVPVNKGKKMIDYMSPEAIERTKATRFKKGQLPPNTKSDGVIAIRHGHKERGGRPYKWIRINQANWKMLHVFNWEKKYGPVPAGHIVVFKNGDTMNCEVSNLQMISRKQHAANTRNKDGWIAMTMSHVKGKGKVDYDLHKKILQHPELIDLKRQSLNLNRTINEHRKTS